VRIAIRLAKELGFETVAEGVECVEDLHFVAQNGATMAQGFVLSPALPLKQLAALLQPGRPSARIGALLAEDAPKARQRAM
jgi:EAL domain-containing protein (putative c-di-GMP-specific phosphodiesterase class I)